MKDKLFFTVTLVLAVTLIFAMPVSAGTYQVTACNAAPDAVNNSWTFETSDLSYYFHDTVCPNDSDGFAGLAVRDDPDHSPAPGGSHGRWVVVAPDESSVSAIDINAEIGVVSEPDWTPFIREADGNNLYTCSLGPDDASCGSTGSLSYSILDTSRVEFGFECLTGKTCISGTNDFATAYAYLYSATVTISDPTSPALTVTSSTFNNPGNLTGTQSASFAATDNTGIKQAKLLIDGFSAISKPYSCDYTYTIPCSDQADQSLSYDVTSFSEGAHTAKVVVTDAAGNETSSDTWSFTVASGANSNTTTNPTTTTTTTPTTTTEQTTTTPTPTNPVAKSSPKLKITKSTYSSKKKRLTVSGTCSKLVEGKKLSLTFKPTKKSKSIRKKATCKSRKFKVSFKLRKKRHGSLTVSYVGSDRVEGQAVARRA